MSNNTFDPLGDRCKQLEQEDAGRKSDPTKPLIARLDGHGFSKFTRGLRKPFDPRFADLMALTTKYLVAKTHAVVGYTQSDEITLMWAPVQFAGDRMFSGKFQKLTSLLAASATGVFNRKLHQYLPEKEDGEPEFDCRVWNVPTLQDAVDALVWRENDALKNSVSMLATAHFTEKEVDRLSTRDRKELLLAKGVDWEACHDWAKRGRFFHRAQVRRELTLDELLNIPEKHRPSGPVLRSAISQWDLPLLSTINNLEDVIFKGADPVLNYTAVSMELVD